MALVLYLLCLDAYFAVIFQQFNPFADFQIIHIQGFDVAVKASFSWMSKPLADEFPFSFNFIVDVDGMCPIPCCLPPKGWLSPDIFDSPSCLFQLDIQSVRMGDFIKVGGSSNSLSLGNYLTVS